MYIQAEKTKENKSRAIANSVGQKKKNVKQGVAFSDNRQSAIVQRNIAAMLKNSGSREKLHQKEKKARFVGNSGTKERSRVNFGFVDNPQEFIQRIKIQHQKKNELRKSYTSGKGPIQRAVDISTPATVPKDIPAKNIIKSVEKRRPHASIMATDSTPHGGPIQRIVRDASGHDHTGDSLQRARWYQDLSTAEQAHVLAMHRSPMPYTHAEVQASVHGMRGHRSWKSTATPAAYPETTEKIGHAKIGVTP